jgi:hypothetical protein
MAPSVGMSALERMVAIMAQAAERAGLLDECETDDGRELGDLDHRSYAPGVVPAPKIAAKRVNFAPALLLWLIHADNPQRGE